MNKLKSNVKILVEILLIFGLVFVVRMSILILLPNTSGAQGGSQPTSEDISAQTSYPHPGILLITKGAALATNPQPYRDGSQPYPDPAFAEATASAALAANPQPYPGPSHMLPQPPTITPVPTPMPTLLLLANGWYSYTEPTTGFSINYPQDAHFSAAYNPYDNHFQGIELVFNNPPGDYGISIVFHENPEKLTLEEYAKSIYQQAMGKPAPPDFIAGFSNTTVSELPALKIMPPGLLDYIIYMVKGNTIIAFKPYAHNWDGDPNNKNGQTAFEICEKIIASVSFKPIK
jgi:hypothetical protein